MPEKLKILDIEKKVDSFVVIFEVPGEPYGQSYPKRMSHSFHLEDKLLEKKNGEYRFEKNLRRTYIERPKRRKLQNDDKFSKVKDEVKGKDIA